MSECLTRLAVFSELLSVECVECFECVTMEFMVMSWHSQDEEDEDEDEEETTTTTSSKAKYVIRAFGVNREGRSMCLRVDGFTPYFYVRAPATPPHVTRVTALANLERFLKERCKSCIGMNRMQKKEFWGFTNGEMYDFIRLKFQSLAAMRKAASSLGFPVTIGGAQTVLKIYESNIDPLLRFMHIRDLRSVGWLRTKQFVLLGKDASSCDIAARCEWRSVDPAPEMEQYQAPLLVASFDIECNSAHGDFPVAKKDYRRLAIDIESAYERCGIKAFDSEEAKKRLHACMFLAFSLDDEIEGGKIKWGRSGWDKVPLLPKMAKLELKRPPPPPPSKERTDLIQTIQENLDDIYFALKNPPVKGGGCVGCDDDEGEDDIETTVVGQLTSIFRKVFQKRWPLHGDAVIQIGLTLGLHAAPVTACNSEELSRGACPVRHILVLGSCEPIEEKGTFVRSFDKEEDLLLAFVGLVRELDPDVLLGYNIYGFDMSYMYERAIELMGPSRTTREFCRFGRIEGFPSAYVEQKLSSSALGDNVLKYIDMHGRIVIDLMKVVQRDHRLDSYKLDAVAEHFTGLRKNDVSPNDVFRLQRGSAADRKVIAEYCLQDCALCNQIAAKLQILTNNSGMANVCRVPLSFIFMRGQGVKIFSLVAHRCRQDEFLIPVRKKVGDSVAGAGEQDGYEGAIVLEPETGMYLETPVSVLDYNSLYPSSMISHNLSHDSFVIDPKFDNLPGIEYIEVPYDLYEGEGDNKRVVGRQVCRWARPNKEGAVLPRILKDLLAQRKATRKKIETEPDPFVKAVLDGLQLAYKVTANSLYGQMGARTSPLYLKHIAACTTAVGRNMILTAKEYVEGPECGGKVVYGDSVTGYTPVPVRIRSTGRISILKIEDLASRYGDGRWIRCTCTDDRKESCELGEVLDAWTSSGWMRLERVIRHYPESHKRILRIVTDTAVVDATDEHSLLDENGLIVHAGDVEVGDRLLHRDIPVIPRHPPPNGDAVKSRTEARMLGMLVGSTFGCHRRDTTYSEGFWSLNHPDPAKLEFHRLIWMSKFPDLEWEVLPPGPTRHGYSTLSPKSEDVDDRRSLIDYTRNMAFDGDDRVVPRQILCARKTIRYNFWKSFCNAKRHVDDVKYASIASIDLSSQLTAASVYMLATSLGYAVFVNPRRATASYGARSSETVYHLTVYDPKIQLPPRRDRQSNTVKSVEEVPYSGYVYDLTTQNHEFAAGVGRMIVHNTDSIFIVFKNVDQETGEPLQGRDALASSIKQGQSASKGIKPHLPMPHNLEYEKTMFPLILLSKKRYVGLLYENDPDATPKQKSMGIALKRRDYAPVVKQIYGGIIDIILNDRDIPKAVDFLKTRLRDLAEGRYEIVDLIISKTLRSYYKIPYQIPHWVLAKRMHERDPGSAPQSNDRVPYVFVETSKRNALMGDRIEHADYVSKAIAAQKEGLKKPDVFVDTKLYIQNQIQKPCLQLLAIELEKLPGYVPRPELSMTEGLDDLIAAKGGNVRKARERLDTLREREVERLMFEPVLALPEIRQRDNRCNGQLDMHAFFGRDDTAAAAAALPVPVSVPKALPVPKAAPPAKKKKDTVASKRIDSFFAAK